MADFASMKVWLATMLSSFMSALAFLFPTYFGALMLVYCVPILLVLEKKRVIGFWFFLATILFWSIHSYAVGQFCFQEYQWLGALFFIFLITYLSIARYVIVTMTMYVFGSFKKGALSRPVFAYPGHQTRQASTGTAIALVPLKPWRKWISEGGFLCGEAIFWYIISFHIFFIFGNNTGYCCAHPALPLIDTEFMHDLISIGGATAPIFFIMAINWLIAGILKKSRLFGCLVIVAVLIALNKKVELDDSSMSQYAYIIPPKEQYVFDWAAEVHDRLMKLHEPGHEHISTIIMPESAFQFDQNYIPEVVATLNQTHALEDTFFVCGCYRNNIDGKNINSLFYVNKNRIINYYDKKTLFPFTEFQPWDWLLKIDKRNKFGKSRNCRRLVGAQQSSGEHIMFFICSDIFFDTQLLFSSSTLQYETAIFISNDSWCDYEYFRELMNRYAWLFAVSRGITLCYVSYFYGYEYGMLLKKEIPVL